MPPIIEVSGIGGPFGFQVVHNEVVWVLQGTTFNILNIYTGSLITSLSVSGATSFYNEAFSVDSNYNLAGPCNQGKAYSISKIGSVNFDVSEPISSGLYSQSAAIDQYGNVYIYIGGSGYLTKYNSAGTVQWTLTGLSAYAGTYSACKVDLNGNIYVGNTDFQYITQTVFNGSGGSATLESSITLADYLISIDYSKNNPGIGYIFLINGDIYSCPLNITSASQFAITSVYTYAGSLSYNNCTSVLNNTSGNYLYFSSGSTLYTYDTTNSTLYTDSPQPNVGTIAGLGYDYNTGILVVSGSTGTVGIGTSGILWTNTSVYGQLGVYKG